MKIALIQTNPVVGDIAGNTQRAISGLERAASDGVELAIFPEQTIIGYPAKDLWLRRRVIDANLEALDRIAEHTRETAAIVGYIEPNDAKCGRPIFNSAALLSNGRLAARWRKRLLPTYDIFDELRYFEPGEGLPPAVLGDRKIGVTICEDIWSAQEGLYAQPLYSCDPVADLAAQGADLVVNISASPFTYDKHHERVELIADHARRNRVQMIYVNQVGGNDEVLFDGASCMIDARGQVVAQARSFGEDYLLIDTDDLGAARREPVPRGAAGLHAALTTGVRDYVRKCGFKHVVVGLSGGIDSAVVAALASDALGPQNVRTVAMPSRFSSDHSVTDARALAENLGIEFSVIKIEAAHAAFESMLAETFTGRATDVTEENIQARVRGTILMSITNKFGSLLLTTGNKSELAVGYCTLYGDMCGGLAVISDVPKTLVYELARHINQRADREIIPPNTLAKPPSAELRPNQTDQQSLPPYDVLDAILERYEVRLQSEDEIIAAGFEGDVVREVVRKIHLSEYKRQQAAPGLKVTSRAFGFGRRMPIAARPPR